MRSLWPSRRYRSWPTPCKARFTRFTTVMTIGALGETLGYLGRALSHQDPFGKIPYITQSVCLIISPIFLAAGLYLLFPEVIHALGIRYTRIRTRISISRLFIICDIAAFLFLSAGAGLLSVPRPTASTSKAGLAVLSVGVVFQASTVAVFLLIVADVAVQRRAQLAAVFFAKRDVRLSKDACCSALTKLGFRGLLFALPIAAFAILIERVFCAIEFISGRGRIQAPEAAVIVLDGGMVCVALLGLNVFHPGVWLVGGNTWGVGIGPNVPGEEGDE